jgi:copper chaperone NosL
MNRRAAAIVTMSLAANLACGVNADGPPAIEVDRTPCAHCGMLVSEPLFAAAYKVPGAHARIFDDIACLVKSAKREGDADALRFWFHDAATGYWIPGANASFVKSARLRTPMSGGLVAYGELAAAQRGAIEHHGRVIPTLSDLMRGEL